MFIIFFFNLCSILTSSETDLKHLKRDFFFFFRSAISLRIAWSVFFTAGKRRPAVYSAGEMVNVVLPKSERREGKRKKPWPVPKPER